MRFLFSWQHANPTHNLEGVQGVHEVLSQLQGCEISAVAWERDVLPVRLRNYDRRWLDQLSHSGEVSWGRRFPAQPDPEGKHHSGQVRHSPIGLYLREQTDAWLSTAPPLPNDETLLSSAARQVLALLRQRGAVFFQNLVRETNRLPIEIETALGELVAFGFVTGDGFGGLRALLIPPSKRAKINQKRRAMEMRRSGGVHFSKTGTLALGNAMQSAGRWSLFRGEPDLFGKADEAATIETVARALLRRWGVVFHRVVMRETGLPPWRDLLRFYRRMEARGELRGGRFVEGFSGEQYALPEAVESLRAIRRAQPDNKLITVCGADPLNLAGIITPGERVAARAKSRIVYRNGVPVAIKDGREVRILERDQSPTGTREIYAALVRKAM
jgi:ATP-dependent Lhr-like helicase